VVRISARTARQLNKWIFPAATSMPVDLLGAACMCCQRISILLESWFIELDFKQEAVRHINMVTQRTASEHLSNPVSV
jgi:hypothetical protein